MTTSPADRLSPTAEGSRKVCYLSRKKGWTDPAHPRRPVSEVNLLAVYLGAPVWTLRTAWLKVFNSLPPGSVEQAYLTATARARLSDGEVRILRELAEHLHVELRVTD
jgi:hypothetical protein